MRRLPRPTVTRVAILLAGLLVGYFIFVAVGDALLSHRISKDEERLHTEIAELEQQQRDLQAIRDYVRTDAYIEGVARSVLGWVRPGETLIAVSSNVEPTPAPDGEVQEPRPWWEIIYSP